MAYKFQLGDATLSGSVTIDESLTVTENVTLSGLLSSSAKVSGSQFFGDGSNLTGISTAASPGGSDTFVQFNQNSVMAGNSGLVYDGSGSLSGSSKGQFHTLWIDSDQITSTAAELNKLDGVTATSTELNYLDITTLGTAQASKALTWAANSTWTAAGGTCADLGIVTTVDMNAGTLDGVSIGKSVAAIEMTGGTLNITGDTTLGTDGQSGIAFKGMPDFQSGATFNISSSAQAADNISVGSFYIICSGAAAQTMTLPAVNQINDGTVFHIKRPAGMENNVTIAAQGDDNETIDEGSSIVLESELAAVSLLWDSTADIWHVF